jgi:FixJ family two-component response regulator
MGEQEKLNTLTPKQREALSKIVADFLSVFEEDDPI